MEVAAVDYGDVDRRMPELARRVQPAEPTAENEDTVSDAFRIPKNRAFCRFLPVESLYFQ